MLIGLIADTHGLLRAAALQALTGVDAILHAGDVGGLVVLDGLRTIAPVRAVAGNTDDPAASGLESAIELEALGLTIHVSHGHELGSPTPAKLLAAYSADILIYGHTHKALVHREGIRLVINPGAAGPRRFDLRPSVARLTIVRGAADVEIVELPD
jgi:putative phosphoesterase